MQGFSFGGVGVIVSESRAKQAITCLAETDESAAAAKAYMEEMKNKEKTILGIAILESELSGQQAKEAEARSSEAYKDWQKKYHDAVYNYELARNKRTTEALIIEMWRSENANRRVGNVV